MNPPGIETEKPDGGVDDPVAEEASELAGSLHAPTSDTAIRAVDGDEETVVDRSGADAQATLPEPAKPPNRPAKRRRRSRKTSAGDVAVAEVVGYGDGSSGAPQPLMTFVNEMTALDEDIRQLRRQLAEKLLLQNTQLKKMLGRFDAP
ncbi:hypothetical protein N182_27825 [Sinorhizobium sp. GL2]|nr:hypothetical protein N182_27825 [Sinorhizobium sp. GL2]